MVGIYKLYGYLTAGTSPKSAKECIIPDFFTDDVRPPFVDEDKNEMKQLWKQQIKQKIEQLAIPLY